VNTDSFSYGGTWTRVSRVKVIHLLLPPTRPLLDLRGTCRHGPSRGESHACLLEATHYFYADNDLALNFRTIHHESTQVHG